MVAEPTPMIANPQPSVRKNGPELPAVSQPATVEETGLEQSLVADLMLKAIHFAGRPTARHIVRQIALSFPVVEQMLAFLRQEQAIEVVGTAGVGEQGYQYALTDRGRKQAEDALARSQYTGPAPVPFQLYTEVLAAQSVNDVRIDRETFEQGLSHLVLGSEVLSQLGPAVNSGKSVLIYGKSGNGKSSITMAIGRMLPGAVLIPYAVEVHGQIVKVFDPRVHQLIVEDVSAERRQDADYAPASSERRRDRRWAIAKRPVVSVGGELTLQELELRYSPLSHFYIAPLQWKANSGVLIVDDFGRQMIQPQELLNRWIVPMEQGIDHLSMHTGDTIELPFDTLLIFSSNIPPGRLGDEAFFRRIRHKVETPNPTEEEYLDILRVVCKDRNVAYSDEAAQYLLSTHYRENGRERKACHPRDIADLLVDITGFYSTEPKLEPRWIDLACHSYFVDMETVT
ncbi:MAG: ATP-binding protein [Dehalococcoidia bacterium]